nr:EscC/YscC/HrcC family type III secretion system outer membrane ring protein [Sodalis glossinidius]
MIFIISSVHAKTLPWRSADFSLRARQMPLSQVLSNLAENYDTVVIIDPEVNSYFSGFIPSGPPLVILNKLMSQYHLVFYFDGDTLFIYPASRLKRQVITLRTLRAAEFVRYLQNRHVPESKSCEIRHIPDVNALDISGVPACLERVSQLATMLDGELTKRKGEAVSMNIYPLKYATAMDDRYQYRDQTVLIPGIVSVLRDMNRGAGAASPETTSPTQGLPMFSADPRQNAVIVRDYAANMAGYRQLIAALDQRPQMIEIAVMIIDVDVGDINKLGIDWSGAMSLGGSGFSFNSDGDIRGGFSSVISNTNDFMVRLNVLEQRAHAYILSQPSVVTLNNIQAVLDKNVTFYTKLQGDKFAKLESVTTGSLLRVTPRLMEDQGKQNIMLSLNIQDGQQTSPLSATDPLPQVQNSEIASQATLRPGQSLLLGGFQQDKQKQGQKKIPLLGDIPLLGHLFRSSIDETHSVMRLFLIKATVASSDPHHE